MSEITPGPYQAVDPIEDPLAPEPDPVTDPAVPGEETVPPVPPIPVRDVDPTPSSTSELPVESQPAVDTTDREYPAIGATPPA